MTHKKVEKCLLVRHNQTLHVVIFRASGRPCYATRKQELLVFRAITAFRSESDDIESHLPPMQEEVIVGARCGSLLYKLTKLVHTLSYILISFSSSVHSFRIKTCKIVHNMLQTIAFYVSGDV